jgi:outer membrane lipoprotein-sorting protein
MATPSIVTGGKAMPETHDPLGFFRATDCLGIESRERLGNASRLVRPRSMRIVSSILLLAVLLLLARSSAAAEPPLPPVRQVVERLNDLFRVDSSKAELTLKVVTDRYHRELTLHAWTRGKDDALLVVRAPAREAGAATLRSKEGLWIYAPRADRLVRLPRAMLAESWMGSHFTNEDLVRETDFLRDYDTSLAWKEAGGKRQLQATLVPKPKTPVVWSRVVYLLDPSDYLPLRAEFYDQDRIARALTFADPHVVSGRRVPFTLQMVPADKPGEETRLEYQQLQFGVPVDPSLFTQRGLRQVARP